MSAKVSKVSISDEGETGEGVDVGSFNGLG